MTADGLTAREVDRPGVVPEKCAPPPGAGIKPLPCTKPGSLPRCQLCPKSPTYWRRGATYVH